MTKLDYAKSYPKSVSNGFRPPRGTLPPAVWLPFSPTWPCAAGKVRWVEDPVRGEWLEFASGRRRSRLPSSAVGSIACDLRASVTELEELPAVDDESMPETRWRWDKSAVIEVPKTEAGVADGYYKVRRDVQVWMAEFRTWQGQRWVHMPVLAVLVGHFHHQPEPASGAPLRT